jgi:hypothetical protein
MAFPRPSAFDAGSSSVTTRASLPTRPGWFGSHPELPYRMAVLQALRDIFKVGAARAKPLWRRMVENHFFNVQPTGTGRV